jgi:cob(I)alamin adenosyltransferase
VKTPPLQEGDVQFLEKEIDVMEAELPALRSFILPGGHTAVSFCHVARTVCRRAERLTTALNTQESVDMLVLKYLNRLSDYFFVLSRKMAQELGAEELPWRRKEL